MSATAGFDYIVIGGGAAGCVLAHRLSDQSKHSVLLLEAGPDFAPGSEPADILDPYPTSYYNKNYMWPDLKVHWRTKANSSAVAFDQARVIGGGSTVMGMVALRGTPDDYDEWERLGARGWGWKDVLPYFRKLESDLDFDGEMHGRSGPIPIRRVGNSDWTPVASAASQHARDYQLPLIEDMNADFRDGYCSLPMSNWSTRRASTAICYLNSDVRARNNLTIIGNARVNEFTFDGSKVTGVGTNIAGETRIFQARETILCAGALNSPAMLLRSGIGPADELGELGIEVRTNLPGVGRNLQNHAALFIGAHLRKQARQSAALRTLQVTCFRLSTRIAECPATDMYFNVQSKSSWNAVGQQIANFGPVLWKPMSRGRVSLVSQKAEDAPSVELNFLSDPRDLERMRWGFRWTADFLASDAMRALFGKPFPVRFNDRLRRLNRLTTENAVKSFFIAKLLNTNSTLTDHMLAAMTGAGTMPLAQLVKDDDRLDDHIRTNIAGTFHVCGTCRMGASNDPNAVLDPDGRVRGIDGLRVADASAMPNVPRGNTNIPAIMVAEKMAAAIAGAG